jgi:hypothetical protein
MRASFVYVVIGTFALGALGVFAAHGQSVKPKVPERLQRRVHILPSAMRIAGVRRESSICISSTAIASCASANDNERRVACGARVCLWHKRMS